MAKVIGRIPVRELRQRMGRRQKPLKVSVGNALKKALSSREHNPPRP